MAVLSIEIYWDDLIGETKEVLMAHLNGNGNYDVVPISTIELSEKVGV